MRLFRNVNLHAELDKLADRGEQERLLTEAVEHLFDVAVEEKQLENSLSCPQQVMSRINTAVLDSTRIYSVDQIRELSIKYRLRFLDSDVFRSEIPNEALFEMTRLQKHHDAPLSGFKILTPSKLFKLKDCNEDPLLFLSLPNDQYYLIHKWGNDLAWYRALLYSPFRSIQTMFVSLFLMALTIGLSFPET